MKKVFGILVLLLLSGTFWAPAQCNQFYQFEENGEWEMETYNAKGKLTGKIRQKVLSLDNKGDAFDAVLSNVTENEKGKELFKGEYALSCKDGVIYIDMRNYIPQEQMQALGNYEMKMEAENLEFPNSLDVGSQLKDGSINITAEGSAIPIKLSCVISDRKVVAKETLSTAMGDLECYKITSKTTVKNQMGINMTITMNAIDWIAPKYGVVKSESYNKNDKLVGYTTLAYRK